MNKRYSEILSLISHHSSLQFKQRFTLIELLVVIAIIAILAGMLLPALNQARERGRSITCVNNAKTIASAFLFYTDEFKGIIPPTAMTYSDGRTFCWHKSTDNRELIAHYINAATTYECALGGWSNSGGRLLKHPLVCPSRTPEASIVTSGNVISNWGINDCLRWGINKDQTTLNIQNAKPVTRIRYVSRCSLILESYEWTNICGYCHNIQTGAVSSNFRTSYHHNGSTTVAFLDGHVNQMKASQIPDQKLRSSGANEAAKCTFWNPWRASGLQSGEWNNNW